MEVTAVRAEDGKLVAERPILGDSKISVSKYKGDLGIIIGRINAFEIQQRDVGGDVRHHDRCGDLRAVA